MNGEISTVVDLECLLEFCNAYVNGEISTVVDLLADSFKSAAYVNREISTVVDSSLAIHIFMAKPM